jgi:hypothetical protein
VRRKSDRAASPFSEKMKNGNAALQQFLICGKSEK